MEAEGLLRLGTRLENSMSDYLAELALQIGNTPISGEDRSIVRQHIVDALGSAYIGCKSETFKALTDLCSKEDKGVPWPGSGPNRTCTLDAAMLWAFAINASVFEDGSREGACHPAAVVIPAVIALSNGASWEEIDQSVVAGYDVMVRIARGGNPEFTTRGFHPTSITAPFGAAAAAAILSGHDYTSTRNALCLAAMVSGGLVSSFKTGDTQPLQVAWAVRGGIMAAILAGKGQAGYPRILEEGFYPAYLGHSPDPPLDHELQYGYAIRGSYLKPYPGCRHLHPAIDAFGKICNENSLDPHNIKKIEVHTYSIAVETEIHSLKSRGDAYFNIPYALSARAILGKNDYDTFDEIHFENHNIKDLMKKITVIIDPDIEKRYPGERGAIVYVTMGDGKKFAMEVSHPLGEPENPLPRSVTREKFRASASEFLTDQSLEWIGNILDSSGPGKPPVEIFELLGEKSIKHKGKK